MLKKIFVRGIILFFLGVIGISAKAQSGKRVQKVLDKREAQLAKDKEAKEREAEKQQEQKIQAHINMQTKEVQKRMKKSRRKARRNNENKKEFFLIRWFR